MHEFQSKIRLLTPHASLSSRMVFRSAAWLMAGRVAATIGTAVAASTSAATDGAPTAEHRCTASEPLVGSPRRCPWNVGGACNPHKDTLGTLEPADTLNGVQRGRCRSRRRPSRDHSVRAA